MPAYCTPQDLIGLFGENELAQVASLSPGMIDTVKVQRACDDAGDLVDGYLRKRHALPLTAVPPILVKFSAAIARYELHLGGDRQPTEQVRQDRNDALAWLKDVANGKADLPPDAGGVEAAEDVGRVRGRAGVSMISEGDLSAYRGGSL